MSVAIEDAMRSLRAAIAKAVDYRVPVVIAEPPDPIIRTDGEGRRMTDYTADFLAKCDRDGCDRLARWRVTSDSPTPRVTCDCDTAPARRWADSDGRTVL